MGESRTMQVLMFQMTLCLCLYLYRLEPNQYSDILEFFDKLEYNLQTFFKLVAKELCPTFSRLDMCSLLDKLCNCNKHSVSKLLQILLLIGRDHISAISQNQLICFM